MRSAPPRASAALRITLDAGVWAEACATIALAAGFVFAWFSEYQCGDTLVGYEKCRDRTSVVIGENLRAAGAGAVAVHVAAGKHYATAGVGGCGDGSESGAADLWGWQEHCGVDRQGGD